MQGDVCPKEKAPYIASLEQTIFEASNHQHCCTVSSEEETMVK